MEITWQFNIFPSNVKNANVNSGYTYEAAKKEDSKMSPGLAAGISIVATLVVGLLVALLFTKCKRKRASSRESLLRSVDRYQPMTGVAEGAQ